MQSARDLSILLPACEESETVKLAPYLQLNKIHKLIKLALCEKFTTEITAQTLLLSEYKAAIEIVANPSVFGKLLNHLEICRREQIIMIQAACCFKWRIDLRLPDLSLARHDAAYLSRLVKAKVFPDIEFAEAYCSLWSVLVESKALFATLSSEADIDLQLKHLSKLSALQTNLSLLPASFAKFKDNALEDRCIFYTWVETLKKIVSTTLCIEALRFHLNNYSQFCITPISYENVLTLYVYMCGIKEINDEFALYAEKIYGSIRPYLCACKFEVPETLNDVDKISDAAAKDRNALFALAKSELAVAEKELSPCTLVYDVGSLTVLSEDSGAGVLLYSR